MHVLRLARRALQRVGLWDPAQIAGNVGACMRHSDATLAHFGDRPTLAGLVKLRAMKLMVLHRRWSRAADLLAEVLNVLCGQADFPTTIRHGATA